MLPVAPLQHLWITACMWSPGNKDLGRSNVGSETGPLTFWSHDLMGLWEPENSANCISAFLEEIPGHITKGKDSIFCLGPSCCISPCPESPTVSHLLHTKLPPHAQAKEFSTGIKFKNEWILDQVPSGVIGVLLKLNELIIKFCY